TYSCPAQSLTPPPCVLPSEGRQAPESSDRHCYIRNSRLKPMDSPQALIPEPRLFLRVLRKERLEPPCRAISRWRSAPVLHPRPAPACRSGYSMRPIGPAFGERSSSASLDHLRRSSFLENGSTCLGAASRRLLLTTRQSFRFENRVA